MAFPRTFAMDFRSGNPAVFEITAGMTPIQRGNDLPGATSVNPALGSNPFRSEGMVVNYKGQTYCQYRNEVFRYRPGSFDDWEEVYTDSVQSTDQGLRHTRLLQFSTLDGDTALCFAYNDSSGRTHSAYSTTGDSGDWTTFDYGSNGDGPRLHSLIFQNQICWTDSSQNSVIFLDPINETRVEIDWSSLGWNTNQENWMPMFIHQDDLYLIGVDASVNRVELAVFTGTDFSIVGTIDETANRWLPIISFLNVGKPAVWSDGTYIHFISNGLEVGGNNGNSYWRISLGTTNPVEATELSDPVIPAAIRDKGTASNLDRQDRWDVYVDNDSDPGNPIVYLLVLDQSVTANNWTIYQYIDTSTVMTSLGTWAAGTYSVPETRYGGNRNLVTSDTSAYATIVGTAAANGGFEISYQVSGDLGTGDATIRLYYDTTQGSQPMVQATLTGTPTGGGTRVGNEIQGVVPDYGATTHTLVWNIFTDGVDEDDPVRVMLDAV